MLAFAVDHRFRILTFPDPQGAEKTMIPSHRIPAESTETSSTAEPLSMPTAAYLEPWESLLPSTATSMERTAYLVKPGAPEPLCHRGGNYHAFRRLDRPETTRVRNESPRLGAVAHPSRLERASFRGRKREEGSKSFIPYILSNDQGFNPDRAASQAQRCC